MTVKGLELREIESLADSMGVKVILCNKQKSKSSVSFVIRPTERMDSVYRSRVGTVNSKGHYALFSLLLGMGAEEITTTYRGIVSYRSIRDLETVGRAYIAKHG